MSQSYEAAKGTSQEKIILSVHLSRENENFSGKQTFISGNRTFISGKQTISQEIEPAHGI